MHPSLNIKSRKATYPLRALNYLKGIKYPIATQHQPPIHKIFSDSSFIKYAAIVGIVVLLYILYDFFHHNPSINIPTSSSTSTISDVISESSHAISRKPFSANMPSLNDLNPADRLKLERLIKRQRDPRNALNRFHHNLSPLNHLQTASKISDLSNKETNEISFSLKTSSFSSIFIRQSYPLRTDDSFNHDFVLIFLHGASYSSATWSELQILESLSKQGYICYAVDIPGYGQSGNHKAKDNKWLKEIIDTLRHDEIGTQNGGVSTLGKKYVIVTASMSGKYAIPLLFDEDVKDEMIGMISVAPVGTDKYKKAQYEKVNIPICIIYGEEDKNLAVSSKKNLIQIPNHKAVMIPGGKHAAYKTDPKYFYQQVVKWLNEFF